MTTRATAESSAGAIPFLFPFEIVEVCMAVALPLPFAMAKGSESQGERRLHRQFDADRRAGRKRRGILVPDDLQWEGGSKEE